MTTRDQTMRSAARRFARNTSCTRPQTPTCCRWRSLRRQLMPEAQPIACGSISHGMPDCSTNGMPVSTARSSSGLRPGYRAGAASAQAEAARLSATIRRSVSAWPWPPRQRNNEEVNRACGGLTALLQLILLEPSWRQSTALRPRRNSNRLAPRRQESPNPSGQESQYARIHRMPCGRRLRHSPLGLAAPKQLIRKPIKDRCAEGGAVSFGSSRWARASEPRRDITRSGPLPANLQDNRAQVIAEQVLPLSVARQRVNPECKPELRISE